METRSKAQRDAGGADATGLGSVIGETEIRSARDPSPPILSLVGIRTTPVPSDGSSDDAEQHQEHTDLRHRSGSLTYAYNSRYSVTSSRRWQIVARRQRSSGNHC